MGRPLRLVGDAGDFPRRVGISAVGVGIPANNIAVWNGRRWAALGNGFDGQVYAIAIHGTDVYVGGEFTQAGSVPALNVARWDGSNGRRWGAFRPSRVIAPVRKVAYALRSLISARISATTSSFFLVPCGSLP